jgi:hypothetical protein
MPERHARALRHLLRLHLVHAERLKLVEGAAPADFDAFAGVDKPWNRTDLPPGQRFAMAVEGAKRRFYDNWRFKGVRPADRVVIARVVRLRDLKYALFATNQKGSTVVADLLRRFEAVRPQLDLNFGDPAAAAAFKETQIVLHGLRAEFVGARLVPFETLASGVHSPGSCWVSMPTTGGTASSSQAQFWRDRLGLHHLPLGVTLGDQLIRLTFVARLSSQPCPATFELLLASHTSHPNEIWLARPSTGDMPNPRFAQARLSDTTAVAATAGATIDLSSDSYDEAEDELVLLHGRDARLGWEDLEPLDGALARHPRDEDHELFFKTIESRHAALSK